MSKTYITDPTVIRLRLHRYAEVMAELVEARKAIDEIDDMTLHPDYRACTSLWDLHNATHLEIYATQARQCADYVDDQRLPGDPKPPFMDAEDFEAAVILLHRAEVSEIQERAKPGTIMWDYEPCEIGCPGWVHAGGTEIQRCDDCGVFEDDDEALAYVLRKLIPKPECGDPDCILCRKRAAFICTCDVDPESCTAGGWDHIEEPEDGGPEFTAEEHF